jgi:hypothetical protein
VRVVGAPVTSAQAWAVVTAILATSVNGWGHAIGAALAIVFLLVDDRDRRKLEREGRG